MTVRHGRQNAIPACEWEASAKPISAVADLWLTPVFTPWLPLRDPFMTLRLPLDDP
jgi:hypothetical protein